MKHHPAIKGCPHDSGTDGIPAYQEAMLHTIEVWVDSVPGLDVANTSGFHKAPWAWLLLAASGIHGLEGWLHQVFVDLDVI